MMFVSTHRLTRKVSNESTMNFVIVRI